MQLALNINHYRERLRLMQHWHLRCRAFPYIFEGQMRETGKNSEIITKYVTRSTPDGYINMVLLVSFACPFTIGVLQETNYLLERSGTYSLAVLNRVWPEDKLQHTKSKSECESTSAVRPAVAVALYMWCRLIRRLIYRIKKVVRWLKDIHAESIRSLNVTSSLIRYNRYKLERIFRCNTTIT